MRRFDVRCVRLAVVAGAIVGSALVSSVATATDESPPIDEPVLVVEPAAVDPDPTDPAATDQTDVSSIGIEQPSAEVIADVVAEVIADVIEPPVVVEAIEPPVGAEVDGATLGGEAEPGGPDVVMRSAAAPDATVSPLESETEHEGGSGGKGNPNRVTFSVTWIDQTDLTISDLDAVLPANWRTVFELSADSETGKGMPTSATCTYSPGSDVLSCEYDNPGHGSGADGLIVPARPTATYTVTVNLMDGWTIGGANDGPYSVRDTCPRGGEDHEGDSGGHESGGSGDDHEGDSGGSGGDHEGDGGGHEGGSGGSAACVHRVVMRQINIVVPPAPPPAPPVVEPVAEAIPPVVTVPVVTLPVLTVPVVTVSIVTVSTEPASAPVAEPVVAAPSTLPATGGSFSMILVIAGLLVAIGSAAAGLTRRTS